jgi:hypothetical protein
VKPLEIWNGIREIHDPLELTNLVKNLYKIVVPVVNEALFGRPFESHARAAHDAVAGLLLLYTGSHAEDLFRRFPDPPVGDLPQKELYREVKADAVRSVRSLAAGVAPEPRPPFPDSLFDFREMRLIDNEFPYIIFTDKEFRVIHGIAIVYLWLIDLDSLFLGTLGENGVDPQILKQYRRFTRQVQKENPLTVQGRRMDPRGLAALVSEKLRYEDYLDVFEDVYRWFEKVRERLEPPAGREG